MEDPTQLLLQAAARLNADGHIALASDLHQLARKWAPPEELVGNVLPMQQTIDLPTND